MITKLILVFVIVGLIVYDVFAGALGQPTESAVLRDWARDWTLLPFTAGFLLGHWFAPMRTVSQSGWMLCIPIMAVLFGVDLFMNLKYPGVTPGWRYSLWYAAAGIPVGMLLWGQHGSWSVF